MNRLTQEQAALTKQINRLEKDIQKAEEQARKNALKASTTDQQQPSTAAVVKTGLFAGFLLALTGMFAGIAALGKEIVSSISSPKQTSGEQSPAPVETSVLQPTEFTQYTQTGSPSTVSDFTIGAYPYRQPSRLEFRALAKGCSIGLLITVGFFFLGLLVYGLAFPLTSESGNYFGLGVAFLFIALGFALGSLIFLRNVAPLARIKGIGVIRDFVINKNSKKPGLNNPLAVKGLVGVITCVSTYLIFMSIGMMLTQHLATLALCIGILLGPILAAIISHRTFLAELQV